MPKKQLNTTGIANELEQSIFFSSPAQGLPRVSEDPREDPGEDSGEQRNTPDSPVVASPVPEQQSPQAERTTRTVEPNGRTVEEESREESREASRGTLLDEITHGVKTERRPTERYSFEIYSDQIPHIEELQYLFKKRTGQKLSASRILREALEAYVHHAFEAMKRKQ